MERPQRGGVADGVNENDRVLEVRDFLCSSTFAISLLLSDYGHLVVDAEHSADEEAVDYLIDDVLLLEQGVRQLEHSTLIVKF